MREERNMNNDLISREALKKALHNFFDGKVIDEPAYILRDVFCHIDGAPTVELDEGVIQKVLNKRCMTVITNEYLIELLGNRPKGELGKWVISEIRCPNCLEYFQTDCYSTEELKKCPNCGADMRKGD